MNSLRMSFWIVPERLRRLHALLLGGDDVERQHRQHGAVHGHRHRHLVERNAGKQRAHVVDRIDRHPRHADVAADARVIRVVAAVGGEIEGDREAFLPGGEIAAVEGVGILRRGEPGILPDGPGLRDVHGGVGAAQIGRDAGIGVEEVEALDVVRAIDRLHRDAFGREPGGGRGGGGRNGSFGKLDLAEIWNLRPSALPQCGFTTYYHALQQRSKCQLEAAAKRPAQGRGSWLARVASFGLSQAAFRATRSCSSMVSASLFCFGRYAGKRKRQSERIEFAMGVSWRGRPARLGVGP